MIEVFTEIWLKILTYVFLNLWQDVMVVGEPSLMGGEFGDEDERLITRLENTQYDAANSLDHDNHGFHADSPMPGSNSWGTGVGDRGPGVGPSQGNTPSTQDSDKKSPAVSQWW